MAYGSFTYGSVPYGGRQGEIVNITGTCECTIDNEGCSGQDVVMVLAGGYNFRQIEVTGTAVCVQGVSSIRARGEVIRAISGVLYGRQNAFGCRIYGIIDNSNNEEEEFLISLLAELQEV